MRHYRDRGRHGDGDRKSGPGEPQNLRGRRSAGQSLETLRYQCHDSATESMLQQDSEFIDTVARVLVAKV
jgi:hypothetical protein